MIEALVVTALVSLAVGLLGGSLLKEWQMEPLFKVYRDAAKSWEKRYFELSEDLWRALRGQPPVGEEAESWGSYVLDNETEVEIEASRNQRHVAGEIRLDD